MADDLQTSPLLSKARRGKHVVHLVPGGRDVVDALTREGILAVSGDDLEPLARHRVRVIDHFVNAARARELVETLEQTHKATAEYVLAPDGLDLVAAVADGGEPMNNADNEDLFEREFQPTRPTRKFVRASDLGEPTPTRWLARRWIPWNAISLLVGAEGIGKSLFWVWVVAAVTNGRALPEIGLPARDPLDVLIVANEDDASEVLARLVVAGADLSRVVVIGEPDDLHPRSVEDDIEAYARTHDGRIGLVVVDMWLSTVDPRLDVQKPQAARTALKPWHDLAVSLETAVMLLAHTNRSTSKNARDRYGVTSELRKIARMTIYSQEDDDQDAPLIIGPEKANGTALAPAARFAREVVQHWEPSDDGDGTVARLKFVETTGMTSRQHVEVDAADDDAAAALSDAEEAILKHLSAAGGKAEPKVITKRAREDAGASDSTIDRAARALEKKKLLGRHWENEHLAGGKTTPVRIWFLPDIFELDEVTNTVRSLGDNPFRPRPVEGAS